MIDTIRLNAYLMLLCANYGCVIDVPALPQTSLSDSESFDANTTLNINDASRPADIRVNDQADSFLDDATPVDSATSDASGPDAILAVCGDGIVTADEECDDGNTIREGCEEYDTVCQICNEACQQVDIQGPFCGDGIHQSNEACDPMANNLHAQVCRSNCGLSFSGVYGGGTGSRLEIDVDVASSVDRNGNRWVPDLDLWVFHEKAIFESPLTTLEYVYSINSTERPAWFVNGEINEDDPGRLHLLINGPTTDLPCSGLNENGLGGRPSEILLIALTARNLSPPDGSGPVVTEATVTFLGLQFPVIFQELDDFYVIAAGGVCEGAGRLFHSFVRTVDPPRFEFDPNL